MKKDKMRKIVFLDLVWGKRVAKSRGGASSAKVWGEFGSQFGENPEGGGPSRGVASQWESVGGGGFSDEWSDGRAFKDGTGFACGTERAGDGPFDGYGGANDNGAFGDCFAVPWDCGGGDDGSASGDCHRRDSYESADCECDAEGGGSASSVGAGGDCGGISGSDDGGASDHAGAGGVRFDGDCSGGGFEGEAV